MTKEEFCLLNLPWVKRGQSVNYIEKKKNHIFAIHNHRTKPKIRKEILSSNQWDVAGEEEERCWLRLSQL